MSEVWPLPVSRKGHMVLCNARQLLSESSSLTGTARILASRYNGGLTDYALSAREVRWEPDGGPSRQTFAWSRHHIEANGRGSEWWAEYTRRYTEDVRQSRAAQSLFRELQELMRAGVVVAVGCFCATSEGCHRALIGQWFRAKGFEVADMSPAGATEEHHGITALKPGAHSDSMGSVRMGSSRDTIRM